MDFIKIINFIKLNKKYIFIGLGIIVFAIIIGIITFSDRNKYDKDYFLSYNMDDIFEEKHIFSSYLGANLEKNKLISQVFFNYGDVLRENNYINIYNKDLEEVKNDVTDFFGIENKYLKKIKSDKISYSYFIHDSFFDYQFDINDDFFGITSKSNSGLKSIIKINYYIDENNYSISLIDKENDELIYMRTPSFENKTFLNLYNEFLDNKCANPQIVLFGEDTNDSAIFPILNIAIDRVINDDIIKDFYCGGRINISGTGSFSGENNFIDKNNIKYNFTENSILFIKRQDCQYPNLIIPCQK